MKGLLVVEFIEVSGTKITEELENSNPEIKKSTEIFMAKFSKEMLMYLKKSNIKANIDFRVV